MKNKPEQPKGKPKAQREWKGRYGHPIPIMFFINDSQQQRLKAEQERTGQSLSATLRSIIDSYFAAQDFTGWPQGKNNGDPAPWCYIPKCAMPPTVESESAVEPRGKDGEG